LLLLLSLSGCKTSRKLVAPEVVEAKEANAYFSSVEEQAFQYQTLSARIRMELSLPGQELNSRVDMKMVKDSAFQLSILPLLGLEVFRIEFNTDSIKLIDRMNKRYAAESYAALKEAIPLAFNFYNLQALFTNQFFVPGERALSPRLYKRFSLRQEGGKTEARITDAMQLLYTFLTGPYEQLGSTRITDSSERYALKWDYADFGPVEDQVFPMQMDAQVFSEGKAAGGLKIYFSRVQRNIPLNMDFSIPERYKRITFAEIIKGIK
jgi:hypothetical protein